MLMENPATSNFGKTAKELTDKAADKIQSGIRSARNNAKDAGSVLSDKVEDVRGEAGPAMTKATDRMHWMGKRSLDAINNTASQARDLASNTSDSIVGYTKNNPVKALAIAAGAGVLLYAAIKALTPSRD
jgi:ElaB/YqjD/DUF883 family membrane-anchored ribosome-binding protein